MKRTESVEEKRKYERIELAKRNYKKILTPYIARFRVKQYEDQEMSFPDWDIVAVKNLSAGGLLFQHSKNLGLGSLLDLRIDLFKSVPTVNCVGKVTRIEQPQPLLIHEGESLK
ncbi:MAG: PilZ domain-containing protein, partial [Candidatus Scalindua sp.]